MFLLFLGVRCRPARLIDAGDHELFEDQRAWFDRTDHEPRNFDKWLCKLLRTKGFELHLIYPYVCQHLGVVSKVRPDAAFYRDDRAAGRIGLGPSGRYLIAENTWQFSDIHALNRVEVITSQGLQIDLRA